ncbi:MAG: RecX family transcriptional regulator [Bacteroidia bacterium]|nr:RecX family transcriptional regulator [Bacteroidia bacterium]
MVVPKTRPTLAVARQKAEQYCAYQERSHLEVETKLRNMGLLSGEIADVLLHLIEHNFLNEERFAIAFATGKHKVLGWGRKKIIYHLKQKGINNKLIEIAIKNIPEDDYTTTLQELIEKKDRMLKETDAFARAAKVTRYLLQKGFESDQVYAAVKKYFKS